MSSEFTPLREPSRSDLARLVRASPSRTLRRLYDDAQRCYWYWPAEQATHAEGARILGVAYDRPPGYGDIVVFDG